MELNQEQKKMLEGEYGKGVAYAMKIQLAIGEAFDAPYMVPITKSHVALSNQEADLWFAEKLLQGGATCRVSPTVNPGFCLDFFKQRNMVSKENELFMERTHNAYKALGATLTYNCTPYVATNIPHFGEIVAFSESSATPYVNAIWGARSNREGANSALCAAITGYVPKYGLLSDENRYGTVLVNIQADMKNDSMYHYLGMCGEKIGPGIPVFTGLPEVISSAALTNLCAELNTSGAYDMFHIPGFTPEARTVDEAFGNRKPQRQVVITEEDIRQGQVRFSCEGGREIEFAMFGCPHFDIDQVRYIAEKIRGKKLKAEMWILTSFVVKELAERMGLDEEIEAAGGIIVPDTCPDQPCWMHLRGKYGVTESPKCAYYTKRREIHFIVRGLDECIDAALNGRVR